MEHIYIYTHTKTLPCSYAFFSFGSSVYACRASRVCERRSTTERSNQHPPGRRTPPPPRTQRKPQSSDPLCSRDHHHGHSHHHHHHRTLHHHHPSPSQATSPYASKCFWSSLRRPRVRASGPAQHGAAELDEALPGCASRAVCTAAGASGNQHVRQKPQSCK